MKDPKGYYARLGLSPDCTPEEIKAAYRRLAKEWHPDISGPEGTQIFQAINEAYATLSDPAARADYEASQQDVPEPAAPPPHPKIDPIVCSVCGKVTAQPRHLGFMRVFSVIFVTTKRPQEGIFCTPCAHKTAMKASLFTALLGWWGLPWGPFQTIAAVFRNLTGGKRDRDADEKMLWHNVLAFLSQGDGRQAYGLAILATAARDPQIAGYARKLARELEAAGISPSSVHLKSPWRARPDLAAAQFAMLCVVPLALGLIAFQAGGRQGAIIAQPPRVAPIESRAPTEPVAPPAEPVAPPAVPTAPVAPAPAPSVEPKPSVEAKAPPAEDQTPPAKKCILKPRTGQVLSGYAGSGLPANKIEITNSSGSNAIVKVRDARNGSLAASFYVSNQESGSFKSLPNGTYKIQYALGDDLGQDCLSFIRTFATAQFPESESVRTAASGANAARPELFFELYAADSGDGEAKPIPQEAFGAR